ncbi:MAG TPA: type II toxin-antitoxin system HigB family toxin [Blastocatellia bacterium]
MNIFGFDKAERFWRRHPDVKSPLLQWRRAVQISEWRNFAEVRRTFPSADLVGSCVVFNIAGNKYRLISKINYEKRSIEVRYVLAHQEYDRDSWKKDC